MSDAPVPTASGPRTPGDAGYDFPEDDKEKFRALAASMSFVGVCLMLFGVLAAVFSLAALYAGFVSAGIGLACAAAVCILVAWWTVSAGRSLSALVATRGRDFEHLMAAVAQLRHLFAFARVAVVVCAVVISGVAGAVVWCMFVLDKGGRCLGSW